MSEENCTYSFSFSSIFIKLTMLYAGLYTSAKVNLSSNPVSLIMFPDKQKKTILFILKFARMLSKVNVQPIFGLANVVHF